MFFKIQVMPSLGLKINAPKNHTCILVVIIAMLGFRTSKICAF